MTARKAASWTAAALLLTLAIAFVAVKAMIDPERLKETVRERVRKAWSRELTLSDVKLEFTPLPSIHARDIALAGPGEPAMRAAAVIADLELVPLLLGETRYRTIYVKDGTIVRGGSTWHIEQAVVESGTDLHQVKIAASLFHNRRPLAVEAEFDDLSRLGATGAVTQGRVELQWNEAKLVAEGRMPLDGTLAGHALHVDFDARSLKGLAELMGATPRKTAPFTARFDSREAGGRIELAKLTASLGRLHLTGDATYQPGPKPLVHANLHGDRLDWAQAYLDVGGEPRPPPEEPEMFHDTPLAWWLLTALDGYRGAMEVRLDTFILRNGVVLTDFRSHVKIEGDRVDLDPFQTRMLGGTARGSLRLAGQRKRARLELDGTDMLLERWLHERGSKLPFKGGPMKVTARLESEGESMRRLVGGVDGTLRIRMGPGVLSGHAGEAEAKLTQSFSREGRESVDFECAGFTLPFKGGRASGERLVGARSDASHIVTSGSVDMRTQAIDLRGRLKGRHGVSLAAIAGDVKFGGTLRHPKMSFDEASTPKAVARGAIAVATLGLSAIGTAAADAAEGRRDDPCEAVFR